MKLSILIPVFNEQNTIEKTIRRVLGVDLGKCEKEIIIVNDASTDGTKEVISKLQGELDFLVIHHDKNRGKGAAVKSGMLKSSGDIVLIQDADLEYDPAEYPALIGPIADNGADVVFGSRFMGGRPHRVLYFWHYVGNKFLTTLSNMVTNLNLTDMETGYKVFNRKVVDAIKNQLVSNRFGIEPEITARVKKFTVYEVGISYKGRTYAEGKKINWKDGFAALWAIIRFNIFS